MNRAVQANDLNAQTPEIFMRRCVVLISTIFALLLSSTSFAQYADDEEIVVDRIMARVNDEIITRSDLVRIFPIYLQVAAQVDPRELRTEAGQRRVAEDLLEFMIDAKLLEAQAKKQDMALSAADVNDYVRNYRDSLGMTETQFRQALAQEGVTFDDYKEFMRSYLTRMQILRAEANADVTVTEEEINQKINERYPDGFEQPYFETSHIFIQLPKNATTRMVEEAYEKLDALRDEILRGERSFEDVASEINSDGTRARGGLVGTFTLGDLDENYTRVALGLEPGEISKPVRSQFGEHLIRLEEVETREVADKQAVVDRIRYEIHEEKATRKEKAYLRRLRDTSFVKKVSDDFGI